jgi:hypothetical protein
MQVAALSAYPVMNNSSTVEAWIDLTHMAFVGYAPSDEGHGGIGVRFARDIKAGDVILIARRRKNEPQVIGFGIVDSSARTALNGFKVPNKHWHGWYRRLSRFLAHAGWLPAEIASVLGQTAALRKIESGTP